MSQPKNIIDTFNKKLYNTKVITFLLEVQMRKVELTVKENLKYLTIKKLIETNGNKKRASIKLGCTVRHIDRMIAGYKEKGKAYFIHGNRGRTPAHALSEEQKTEIEQLYLSKYYDCNYTVFTEFLAERENIYQYYKGYSSIDEVRVILRDKYILSPRSHKSTRKRLRKQLLLEQKRAKSKSEKEKIQANIVAVEDAQGNIIPKIKLSENTTKITNPHFKKVYRLYDNETGKAIADEICLHDEFIDNTKPHVIFDPVATWKQKTLTNFTVRELQVPIFKNGKRVYDSPSIDKIRDYCKREVNSLWDEVKRFENPHRYYVDLSQKLWDIKKELCVANSMK